jgi:hypothetical protein
MKSPQVLIDAANSPVQELPPVSQRPEKIHIARPWGFKGTMVKPENWETKEPYKSLAPTHWQFLSLSLSDGHYAILSFARHSGLLPGELRVLGHPGAITHGLDLQSALELGEKLEKAWERLPRPEKKTSRRHNST